MVLQVADDLNPLRCLSLLRAIPRHDCELLDHAGRPEDLLMLAVPVSSGTSMSNHTHWHWTTMCCWYSGCERYRLQPGASGCHPAIGGCGGRRLQRGRHHHEAHGEAVQSCRDSAMDCTLTIPVNSDEML